jgi:hypothetical protein
MVACFLCVERQSRLHCYLCYIIKQEGRNKELSEITSSGLRFVRHLVLWHNIYSHLITMKQRRIFAIVI